MSQSPGCKPTSPRQEVLMKFGSLILVLLLTVTRLSAAEVSGEWQFAVTLFNDVSYLRVTLSAAGEKLSGTLNEMALAGTIKGEELTFTATRPDGQRFGTFKGQANGEGLKGTASWPGISGD